MYIMAASQLIVNLVFEKNSGRNIAPAGIDISDNIKTF